MRERIKTVLRSLYSVFKEIFFVFVLVAILRISSDIILEVLMSYQKIIAFEDMMEGAVRLCRYLLLTVILVIKYRDKYGFFTNAEQSVSKKEIVKDIILAYIITDISDTAISYMAYMINMDIISEYLAFETEMKLTGILFVILNGVIMAPVVEELIFRGCIFSALKKEYGFWSGAICSSIMWALAHSTLLQMMVAFFSGIVYSQLYEKHNKIWMPIVVHCMGNLIVFFF